MSKEIYRWKQHCYQALCSDSKSKLHEAIRKYGTDSFDVEILEDNVPVELLNEREMFWIKFYKSYHYDNPHNYNLTVGGNQGRGYHHTEEWKTSHSRKMTGENNPSKKVKRCWINDGDTNFTVTFDDLQLYLNRGYIKGRIESQKVIQTWSNRKGKSISVGIWMSNEVDSKRVSNIEEIQQLKQEGYKENVRAYSHSDETKHLISSKTSGKNNPRFGAIITDSQKQKCLNTKLKNGTIRRVAMCDIDTGDIIKEFNSASEAGRFAIELGLTTTSNKEPCGVRACCKNRQKTAYGYIWRYID